jgi:stalled ribosome rescue protein Dom34
MTDHYHAVVWMDYQEAHVLMFDREHVEAQRIKSRTHHKHQGKPLDTPAFYASIAKVLVGTHEVLLTGPGLARNEFQDWCKSRTPRSSKPASGAQRRSRRRGGVGAAA